MARQTARAQVVPRSAAVVAAFSALRGGPIRPRWAFVILLIWRLKWRDGADMNPIIPMLSPLFSPIDHVDVTRIIDTAPVGALAIQFEYTRLDGEVQWVGVLTDLGWSEADRLGMVRRFPLGGRPTEVLGDDGEPLLFVTRLCGGRKVCLAPRHIYAHTTDPTVLNVVVDTIQRRQALAAAV